MLQSLPSGLSSCSDHISLYTFPLVTIQKQSEGQMLPYCSYFVETVKSQNISPKLSDNLSSIVDLLQISIPWKRCTDHVLCVTSDNSQLMTGFNVNGPDVK